MQQPSIGVTEKILWTYWHQGWRNAPELVSVCRKSWEVLNPGWRIECLDAETVCDYVGLKDVDVTRPDVSMQKRSLFVRLELLRRYGGVWTDATVYCWQPLDSWLPQHFKNGYFAFRDPGPDRMAASWFMAAERDCPLLVRHSDAFVALFRDHIFSNHDDAATQGLISRLHEHFSMDHRGTLFWTSDFALSYLKALPYFVFHYLFNRLALTNPEFGQLWAASRSLSADGPHLLQAMGSGSAVDALARIESEPSPLHKLNWRYDTASGYWKTVLAALSDRLAGAPES
ncbi:MAG: capsular polysaccharide synthesis protein [Chthoniobacteraceae bacterium]